MKRIVSAAILMIALMTGLAMPAYAETPPNNITTNVVDRSESLDSARVNELVAQVQRETGYQLYVYFTNDFSGTSGSQWAFQAATNSHLDTSKAVLFAVAVKDRKYGSAFPSNTDVSKKASTMEQAAIPAMKDGKWTDAVEAYANQLIAVVHKTDVESAQNSGQSDAAGGVFLTVITWIIGVLVGIGLIVLGIIFGPRGVRSLIDYAYNLRTTKREIKELRVSVPARITALDDSIVKAKDKLSYAVSMYGELPLISAKLHSAQVNLQNAITKLSRVSPSAHGLRASQHRVMDFNDVIIPIGRGEKNVSDAEKALKDLEARVSSIKFGLEQASKTVEDLKSKVSENEKTVARVREKFDEDYLVNLVRALELAKTNVVASKRHLTEAGAVFAANQFDKAEVLAATARENITGADQFNADFTAIALAMTQFSVKRDKMISKFEREIAADTSENAHPSVQALIPAAKAALAEASAKDFLSGNPDKELAKVLEPATEYRNAVARLLKLKESVKSIKSEVNTSVKALKEWQKTALVSNVKDYGVSVTDLEKVALTEVDKLMKADVAGVAWDIKDVSAYDVDSVTQLALKLEYLKKTIFSLTESIVKKVELAIAEEKRRQAEIRAEAERKRKAQEQERKRKREQEEEEEARRRRRMSSSRSRSSGSSYGGGYGGGYDGGSSFSSSGGSFGGGFDSSGGSF